MPEAHQSLAYHQLFSARREAHRRFGSVHDLPIVASAYERCRALYAETGGPLLDVGAGVDQPLRGVLGAPAEAYFSLDDDPTGEFTYHTAAEIPSGQRFGLIVANQFFEHLTIDGAYQILRTLAGHLAPGGRMVITVPNTAHPTRFWAVTHVTPWDFMSLYALYELAGLACVEIARYNKTPGPQTEEEHRLVAMLARLYRIDWCDSILAVGKNAAAVGAP